MNFPQKFAKTVKMGVFCTCLTTDVSLPWGKPMLQFPEKSVGRVAGRTVVARVRSICMITS